MPALANYRVCDAIYLTCTSSPHSVHHMNRLFYLFSLLWCGLFCSGLQAATIEGLYEAEVPVERQTDRERDRVLPLAFQQVLIKVVGQHQLDPDVVKRLSRNASRFTQQFRFQENPEWREYQDSLIVVPSLGWTSSKQTVDLESEQQAPVVPPAPYLLWVRFDESMVNQALMAESLPIWGKERPAMLLWLAIEQQSERAILGGDFSLELQAQIKALSQQRGIPLWLPLLDLEDQQKVSVGDLRGGFEAPILDASKRYRPDRVAVGRLQQINEAVWRVQWQLLGGGDEAISAIHRDSSGLVVGLDEGLNLLLDQLGARFAQHLNVDQKNKVVLRIHGVTDLAAYARVSEYLLGLDLVKRLHIKEVSKGLLLVELEALGDVGAVERLLALGRQLQPVIYDSEAFERKDELHYQLRP
ncbi:hypothetical protein MNBD_GAMMA18-316 [hydrothermal vent metagenome]|uniref:DUF2066 domain-containing protein n=1 Tax=hydrothermal vent metagenome TaxID=652676 RepID=A0A3B0ZNZ2_9ZZZZ